MSSAHRLIVVGSSRIGFAAIERFMGGDGGAHTAALPSEQVLRWVAGVVGGMRVVSVENASRSAHRPSGTFRVAADLDGRASGTVATLETFLSGSSDLPPMVSAARLREAGAAIARVSAVVLAPQADLPHRPRPCAADDRAADRRRGRTPTTPLLPAARERGRSHGA